MSPPGGQVPRPPACPAAISDITIPDMTAGGNGAKSGNGEKKGARPSRLQKPAGYQRLAHHADNVPIRGRARRLHEHRPRNFGRTHPAEAAIFAPMGSQGADDLQGPPEPSVQLVRFRGHLEGDIGEALAHAVAPHRHAEGPQQSGVSPVFPTDRQDRDMGRFGAPGQLHLWPNQFAGKRRAERGWHELHSSRQNAVHIGGKVYRLRFIVPQLFAGFPRQFGGDLLQQLDKLAGLLCRTLPDCCIFRPLQFTRVQFKFLASPSPSCLKAHWTAASGEIIVPQYQPFICFAWYNMPLVVAVRQRYAVHNVG